METPESVTRVLSAELNHIALLLWQIDAHGSDLLHSHESHYQISIPLTGQPRIQSEKTIRKAGETARLVSSPDRQHRHFANEDTSRLLLIFIKTPFIRQITDECLGFSIPPVEFSPWGEMPSAKLQKQAEIILGHSAASLTHPWESQELERQLAETILTLQPGSHSVYWQQRPLSLPRSSLQQMIDCIHSRFQDELTLDDLAAASGFSKFHLIRQFQEHFDMTPFQYLNQVRLTQAEQLLRCTRQDITRIALDSGFGSLSAFQRRFRDHYHTTPSQYRRECTDQ